MEQETFIDQFMTQFLATWAANQFSTRIPQGVADYDWLKDAPIQEANLMARHMWYRIIERMGPPKPWR